MFVHLTAICTDEEFFSFTNICYILRYTKVIVHIYLVPSTFTSFVNIWRFICLFDILCTIITCFFFYWFVLTGFSVRGTSLDDLRHFFSLLFIHNEAPSLS